MNWWHRVVFLILMLPLMGLDACEQFEATGCFSEVAANPPNSSALSSASSDVSEPGLFATSAGAPGPLPMLNAFPSCLDRLDIGFSEELVQFGATSNNFRGSFACFPVNNPVQITATEGAVQVAVEAAAVALPAPNPQTSVARFAIEGRSSITGGAASAAPGWAIQVGYLFPHTGSPTGVEPIVFGATLVNVNDTGGAPPVAAAASVSIDCGTGAPTVLPVNLGPVDVPVEATSICGVSCSCTANATLSGGAAAAAGTATQRLTVIAFNTNGLCGANEMCRLTDPSNPFCVADFGCSNGSVGMPCGHDSECDEASDVICAASGLCQDGSAGTTCSQVGDCAVGLTCSGSVCSTS